MYRPFYYVTVVWLDSLAAESALGLRLNPKTNQAYRGGAPQRLSKLLVL